MPNPNLDPNKTYGSADDEYDYDTLVSKGWVCIDAETTTGELWRTPENKLIQLTLLDDGVVEVTEVTER